jgi:hypothetical protein
VLPTSHLLAATGGAEQPKDKPEKKKKATSSNLSLTATNIKVSTSPYLVSEDYSKMTVDEILGALH